MKTLFYNVENILVSKELFKNKFSCDLSVCKGACCTMKSEYGAPLLESEIEEIEEIYDIVKEYLPQHSRKTIEKKGFWEEKEGMLMTRSIKKKDCVFVCWDNDIAKCVIEKAYFDKKTNFRKPVSCHLFPIRITNFGGPTLKFEKYSECKPALKQGEKEKVNVIEFCKESIIRGLGKNFYQQLEKINGK